MAELKLYRHKDLENLISTRNCETKFGEKLGFVKSVDELKKSAAKFVLLGIPEDIGVKANYGKSGAAGAWKAALKALVNIQYNQFNQAENVIVLGELDCSKEMAKAGNIDLKDPNYYAKLGDLVKQIDLELANIIEKITAAGKTPIIIGGGHNNAYGNIKGAAKGLNQPLNVVNIDAHSDLRMLEHRHSGNGFSYAIEGGFLRKYVIFGLHKNYTPEYIFEEMKSDNIDFKLFEDLIREPEKVNQQFKSSLEFVADSKFGLELDCDVIANFPSSAQSPTGFSIEQIRNFINFASKSQNYSYFHICEAAPTNLNETQVGKAIAYFISDFISNSSA